LTARIEQSILSHLLYDEKYTRKVVPFLKPEYFENRHERVLIESAVEFFEKYSKACTHEVLNIAIANRKDLTEADIKTTTEIIDGLAAETVNEQWLLDETEKFCKAKAVYNAIYNSIAIVEGVDKKRTQESIPTLLQEALAVSFDTNIGHDYFENADDRFAHYHSQETGIKFDIDLLNKITDGIGLRNKTLTCLAAETGGGKSLVMSHIAAATLMQGKNVLIISMEMSEFSYAERIDANLFNTPIKQLRNIDQGTFNSRMGKITSRTTGKLIVKEYPTSGAHAGHFRALIEDLKQKRGFVPDLIVIDYLNICASQRIRANANANSYTTVKAIAEEVRGLAVEYNVPILTATQVNRGGIGSSDISMTDTSESMGLVHALDLYLAIIRTEELDELNQLMIKQLKNRYGDPSYYKRFVVGVDKARMKLYNVEDDAQDDLADSGGKDTGPAFDKTSFGKGQSAEKRGGFDFNF